MTREEAINILFMLSKDALTRDDEIDAINMAIKALETHEERTETHGVCLDDVLKIIDDYIDGSFEWAAMRKKIAGLPPARQWIPCSEETGDGYPEEDGFYYVTEQNYGFYLDADYKQRVTHTSHFKNGDFTDRFYLENNSNITAWMKLPEPFRKGEEDE